MIKIKYILNLVLALLLVSSIFAHGDETFDKAEELITSEISCSNLSNDQLEIIGDYYMEQIHPGESHIRMDEMMGGEGSESLREIHINMAKRSYCNDDSLISHGIMGGSNYMMSSPFMFGFGGMFWIYILAIIIVVTLIMLLTKNNKKKGKKK
jgi:hypothetical protein